MKKRFVRFSLFIIMLCMMFIPVGHAQARTRIRISRTTLKLKPNLSKKISMIGVAARKVKWKSSNKAVATVKNGKVTTYRGGKATITAKAKGKTYRCYVTVVSINYAKVTLAEKGKVTLKVKNGAHTKWSSNNPSVATVNSKGVVTGKKKGSTHIICKTNGKTFRVKVYVAVLNKSEARLAVDKTCQLTVKNSKDKFSFVSKKPEVASVTKDGLVTALKPGKATIICKTGKAKLECTVTVIAPDNLKTSVSLLPAASNVDRQEITVNAYPSLRTYIVYRQSANINKTDGTGLVQPAYMPNHGCAACSLATVLSGYKGLAKGPAYVAETLEKKVFGTQEWTANYSKTMSKQMPMSLYGISRILTYYKIPNTYVRNFPGSEGEDGKIEDGAASDLLAYKQIMKHLKTGNPVVIEVSSANRDTGVNDKLWSNSYHTMVLLGVASSGKVIVADSANRSSDMFGNAQRVKYVTLKSLLPYMFSSSNLSSESFYWAGKKNCGGYILVNPQ